MLLSKLMKCSKGDVLYSLKLKEPIKFEEIIQGYPCILAKRKDGTISEFVITDIEEKVP